MRLCKERLRRNEGFGVNSFVRESNLNLGVTCKEGNDKLLKDLEDMQEGA